MRTKHEHHEEIPYGPRFAARPGHQLRLAKLDPICVAEIIERGLLNPYDEKRLRAEAKDAVRRIVAREPPFDRDWFGWRPDPAWRTPTLPEGWDRV